MNEARKRFRVLLFCVGVSVALLLSPTVLAGVLVPNASFEEPLVGGMAPGWPSTFGGVRFGGKEISLSRERAVDGVYSIRIEDRDPKGGIGLRSGFIPVKPGAVYVASVQAFREEGQAQLYIEFWNKSGTRIRVAIADSKQLGQWAPISGQETAPADAVSLTLLLYSHGANVGVTYYDQVELREISVDSTALLEGTRMGEMWSKQFGEASSVPPSEFSALVADHPRLFFTPQELADLRSRFKSGEGTDAALRALSYELLAQARTYVHETSFSVSYYGGHRVSFPLPLSQPEPLADPPGFTAGRYPYWTMMSRGLQTRLETLALAYALTGDQTYGERARDYALTLATWAEWTDKTYPCGGNSCLDTAHITIGVATVYDMVYEMLTDQERETLRTALIEKGLRPLYADTNQKADHNLHMLRTSALGAGALVVLGEMAQAESYIARAYENFFWYLDQRLTSGQTEGMTYTSYAMDYVSRFGEALLRVTGNDDFFAHPYVQTVLPQLISYFLAPQGRGLVNFSDSDVASMFFTTMSLLATYRDDGLAGWYLREATPSGGAWGHLLYGGRQRRITSPDQLGLPPSKAFWDIGWVALRSGWSSRDHLLAFQSSQSRLGHNQWDQNNFVLNVGGAWLITDPGYPDYSPGPKNLVTKHTIGHNCLLVDGQGQVSLGAGQLQEFFHSPAFDFTTGEAGFGYLAHGVAGWERKILYSRPDYYVVVDRIDALKPIEPELLFHTSTEAMMWVGGARRQIDETTNEPSFRIVKGSSALDARVIHPADVRLTYTHVQGAEGFGPFVKVGTPTRVSETTFVTVLRPTMGEDEMALEVRSIPAEAGLIAIEVKLGAQTEIVLLNPKRQGGVQRTGDGRLAAMGDHAVLRYGEGNVDLRGFHLANGTQLLGPHGQLLLEATEPLTISVEVGVEGSTATIWSAEPGHVQLWVPSCEAVTLNGRRLPGDEIVYDRVTHTLSVAIPEGESRLQVH
ncbi:MAG: heparinase II/III domain-containing protein [Limnochordia bacterium]